MAKKVLIGVAVVVVLFLVIVAMQPSSYSVSRSTEIKAPPATVYSYVSDFNNWDEWSPWEDIDPKMQKTITGTPGSVGSKYHWKSENPEAGEGEMTVAAATPEKALDIDLHFMAPFEANSKIDFALAPKDDGTNVTWTMNSSKNFMMKGMMMFMDVEGMIGKDFEKGLSRLKAKAEAGPPAMTASTAGGATTAATPAATEAATPAPN